MITTHPRQLAHVTRISIDFFPLMRLLCPQADLSRRAYGLKEAKLGAMYKDVFQIRRPEATRRLLEFKQNGETFPDALEAVLVTRIDEEFVTKQSRRLRLNVVNRALDQLHSIYMSYDRYGNTIVCFIFILILVPLFIVALRYFDMTFSTSFSHSHQHLQTNPIDMACSPQI